MSEPTDFAYKFEVLRTSFKQATSKESSGQAGVYYATFILHPQDVSDMSDFLLEPLGQRYQMVLVPLADDDTIQKPKQREERMRMIQSAAMLCKDPAFHTFMVTNGLAEHPNEESVTEGLKVYLGIKSRTEIPEDPNAEKLFNKLRQEYSAWRSKRQGSYPATIITRGQ